MSSNTLEKIGVSYNLNNNYHNFPFQICIEGCTEQLPDSVASEYFQNTALSHQIREVIGVRGKTVDWYQVKKKHDEIFCKVQRERIKLEKPCGT